ncbi:MAG TPA: nucleoside hydrolase [Ktedonobacterales bacterium]|nr:nucleoside hydrolase [Ktedonobacterales bacterium]
MGVETTASSEPKAIVMDVDTGVDDALAIILAHRTPTAQVVAIGTVTGNVSSEQAAINTLKTLDALGASTPVAVGAVKALARGPFPPSAIHGADGLGDADLPAPSRAPTGEHAVDQLLRLVHERPGELSLFASGPLTNLGLALQRDPELPRLVNEVMIMGGAIIAAGNVTPVAEANIYHDPEAAALVFAADWPVTLVGLDVTMRALLRADELARLRASDRPLARFTTRILPPYVEVYSRRFGFEAVTMHDPLAMALLLDPSLALERAQLDTRVETTGDLTVGMTVADRRPLIGPGFDQPNHPLDIPLEVDTPRFITMMMDALLA